MQIDTAASEMCHRPDFRELAAVIERALEGTEELTFDECVELAESVRAESA
jgi:hypothetical protein